jgi:hypothetical protein
MVAPEQPLRRRLGLVRARRRSEREQTCADHRQTRQTFHRRRSLPIAENGAAWRTRLVAFPEQKVKDV